MSVRYGTNPQYNIAILDSAGQETPLLKLEYSKVKEDFIPLEKNEINDENIIEENKAENIKSEKNEKDQNKNNEESEDEKNNEFERYSRDK